MSGIVGLYYRDNQTATIEELGLMAGKMPHRGTDGVGFFLNQSVGLGHCMLHDTPESLLEKLPYTKQTNRLTITFHGRLDNRSELCEATNLKKRLSETTDSEIILESYLKWGDKCPSRMLGDFSFAIWDGYEQSLFCVRDHIGICPFYYYIDDKKFIFASEIKAIGVHPFIPKRPNEERIADFLANIVTEKFSTFYKNIYRLPPGHCLKVRMSKFEIWQYHEIVAEEYLHRNSEDEYEEEFCEIFSNAVKCRIRSAYPVGAELSGGLDSSSVVCCANEFSDLLPEKLHTFSAVFPSQKAYDEREYIENVLSKTNVIPHFINAEVIDACLIFDSIVSSFDEPFFAPNIAMMEKVIQQMSIEGMRVNLNGFDGDTTISYGQGWMAELVLKGQIIRLWLACYKQRSRDITKALRLFLRTFSNVLNPSHCWPLNEIRARKEARELCTVLRDDFVSRSFVLERIQESRKVAIRPGVTHQKYHLRLLQNPYLTLTLEILEQRYSFSGIIPRMPFFDKRLIDYCLALPPKQKFQDNVSRIILRKALKKILPREVCVRKGKIDFSGNVRAGYIGKGTSWILSKIDSVPEKFYDSFIKKEAVQSIVKSVVGESGSVEELRFLLRLISLSYWDTTL